MGSPAIGSATTSAPPPPPPTTPSSPIAQAGPTSGSGAQAAPLGQPATGTGDVYEAGKPAPVAAQTPEQARIATQYKASALRDVADPKTLRVLNEELKARDPSAAPITAEEAKKAINATDVKVLSADDYKAVKQALGGQWTNPAAAADSSIRTTLNSDEAAVKLATARARERTHLSATQPTQAEIDQAKVDLRRIDPGAFETPPKDAVYVNQAKAGVPVSDPTQTKVADHEFTHIVLNKRPGTAGEATQHEITAKLGWNHAPGENANWNTPPGKGLPD